MPSLRDHMVRPVITNNNDTGQCGMGQILESTAGSTQLISRPRRANAHQLLTEREFILFSL